MWKHTKDEQLSIEQLSNGYTKASRMEENNDLSKSTTLTLLHSWAKLKSKVKQGHHRHYKRDKKTHDKQTRHRQMETHPTQKDSKLQGSNEHHPSNSKHVKYSIQLKERI